MRRIVLALLLACGFAACGGEDNTLKGSMSQVYPLKFDEVQIQRGGDPGREMISIEYLKMSGGKLSAKVAKLTVQIGGLANMAGNKIDLIEELNGLPRGTLQRVDAEGTTNFRLATGNVQFDQDPLTATNLSGSFYTTVTTETDRETTRTLNGDFKAKVTEVP